QTWPDAEEIVPRTFQVVEPQIEVSLLVVEEFRHVSPRLEAAIQLGRDQRSGAKLDDWQSVGGGQFHTEAEARALFETAEQGVNVFASNSDCLQAIAVRRVAVAVLCAISNAGNLRRGGSRRIVARGCRIRVRFGFGGIT